jgi:hypothetical protein
MENNKVMAKIKTLVSKETPQIVSRTIQYNEHKFKIVAENYNSNWKVRIYIYTNTGELSQIADKEDIPKTLDIPETEYVNYFRTDRLRLKVNLANVAAAEEYIKLIY